MSRLDRGVTGPSPVHADDLGPLVEVFRPRPWAKWLTIAVFAPLGMAGLILAIVIVVAIVALPAVPLPMALPVAGLGLVCTGTGAWFTLRSWKWLGHRAEVHRGGLIRSWRNRSEARRWGDVGAVEAWSIRVKGREMPHLTVHFVDGSSWAFDEEYEGYERLRGLIEARGHRPSPG